jgi:hypothetical protein
MYSKSSRAEKKIRQVPFCPTNASAGLITPALLAKFFIGIKNSVKVPGL